MAMRRTQVWLLCTHRLIQRLAISHLTDRVAYELMQLFALSRHLFARIWRNDRDRYRVMATIWSLFLDIVDACCSLVITKADIDSMHSKIVTFILMIQAFFGKQHVTYLMHQLLHYPAIIRNFGTYSYCASSRSYHRAVVALLIV
jgi:hypothetical protein